MFTNLLTNMVLWSAAGWMYQGHPMPAEPERLKPIIAEYLTTNAQRYAAAFHWDTSIVASNRITLFKPEFGPLGIGGEIDFSHKFKFFFHGRQLISAEDLTYEDLSISHSDPRWKPEWLKKWQVAWPNYTSEDAAAESRQSLLRAGIPLAALPSPPAVVSIFNEDYELTGKTNLPAFDVSWKLAGEGIFNQDPFAKEFPFGTNIFTRVSGLNKKMIWLYNRSPNLPIHLFENHLSFLGLPTNAVFVVRIRSQPTNEENVAPIRGQSTNAVFARRRYRQTTSRPAEYEYYAPAW